MIAPAIRRSSGPTFSSSRDVDHWLIANSLLHRRYSRRFPARASFVIPRAWPDSREDFESEGRGFNSLRARCNFLEFLGRGLSEGPAEERGILYAEWLPVSCQHGLLSAERRDAARRKSRPRSRGGRSCRPMGLPSAGGWVE